MYRFCYITIFYFLFSCSNIDDKRPNILFISIDDLNDWNEPLNGSNRVFTPFL